MFTLDQVNEIHDRLGSSRTLFEYLRALKDIGVNTYDSFISDGHSEYFGEDGHKVVSPAVHETFTVADESSEEKFLKFLNRKDYLEMSKGLAESGIEKWTFDTNKMTITYSDKTGRVLLKENIT